MTTAVASGALAYPTPDELRDIVLRTIAFKFSQNGIAANVLPGSDHFYRADAWTKRLSIAIANNKIALADINPLSAQGQGLIDLAAVFGVYPRAASFSAGPVIIVCSGTVIIPAGFTATAPDGHKYATIALATLTTGQTVDVISLEAGASTEQGEGVRLTWDSATIGALNPLATVDTGGIVGGTDGDVFTNPDGSQNVERLRQRLLTKLAFPPVGGNWSAVKGWAEESTSSVEAAYPYPAARGPASYDVVVTKSGVSRVLTAPTLAIVDAYINGKMPGQNDLNVTSVTEQPVDVSVVASLPLPQAAGGGGGGWRDANPWPSGEDAVVTAYDSTTGVATVDAVVAPVVGQQVGIWDPDAVDGNGNPAPLMHEYAVTTVGGVSTAWTVSVQGGYGFDPTGAYISAGALYLVDYADDISAQFQGLGPGEKTDDADRLPRARRQPTTDVDAPSAISSILLARVSAAHPEIQDLTYGVRYLTGTTTATTGPAVPMAPGDPPNIVTLKYFAIRA